MRYYYYYNYMKKKVGWELGNDGGGWLMRNDSDFVLLARMGFSDAS